MSNERCSENSTHWTSERAAQGVRAQFDDVLLKVVIENWWQCALGKQVLAAGDPDGGAERARNNHRHSALRASLSKAKVRKLVYIQQNEICLKRFEGSGGNNRE